MAEPPTTTHSAKRVWWSSFTGAMIEFYDFSVYSAASAVVLAPLFFSAASPAVGTALAFATLAIGYASRPVGAIIFGHFGDRIGRKTTLIATLVLMAVATFLIGCLPTTATIGNVAPVLLVLLRCVQGIAAGGEWGGGVTMTTEHGNAKKRGFMGSSTMAGSATGSALGFALFALLSAVAGDALLEWVWRIPFLITAVLFGVALYMRARVEETPAMKEAMRQNRTEAVPFLQTIRKHPLVVLQGAGVVAGIFCYAQVAHSFLVSYGTSELGRSNSTMLWIATLGLSLTALTSPYAGTLADRFGRRKVMLIGIASLLFFVFLIPPLMNSNVLVLIILAMVTGKLLYSLCYSPLAATLSEMYPTEVRYTGISLSYQLGALLGGFGPLACALIVGAFGLVGVAVFLAAGLAVSLVCTYFLSRRNDIDLDSVGRTDGSPGAVSASSPIVGSASA